MKRHFDRKFRSARRQVLLTRVPATVAIAVLTSPIKNLRSWEQGT